MDLFSHPLVDQLKNKVIYRTKKAVEDAVIDPEANQYAANKATETPAPPAPPPTQEPTEEDFEGSGYKKILKRIWKRIVAITTGILLPLLLASLVANESIVYPAPVRVAFFLFTLILCMSSSVVFGVLGVFYLGKGAYHYYVNHMVRDAEPQRIMPAFLAVLPITTATYPESTFKRFMTYPLRYPKTERDAQEVREAMERYEAALGESFDYLDQVKSMPMFAKSLSAVKEWLEEGKSIEAPKAVPPTLPNAPTTPNVPSAPSAPSAPLPPTITPSAPPETPA